MHLPFDLAKIIINYLPLPVVQLLDDSGYVNFNFNIIVSNNSILTPFEQYCRLRMLQGEIGYNGQWYLPVYACLFNAIKADNLDLFNYYLIRFFTDNQNITESAILWHENFLSFLFVIDFLCNKYVNNYQVATMKTNLVNKIGQQTLKSFETLKNQFSHSSNAFGAIKPELVTTDQPFPNIDSINLEIKVISTTTINNAKVMIDLVLNKYPQSIRRDRYINYLNILLNNNIDLTLFNLDPNDEDSDIFDLIVLAQSVLNGKVLNAIGNIIPNLYRFKVYANIELIFSEVLYDLSFYDIRWGEELEVSLYLSNNAIILLNNPSPLDDLCKSIKDLHSGSIKDAETALRLANLVDVEPYLDPITTFDKDLMVQFGLFN